MKKRMMGLLWELIKVLKRSDRDIAKALGVSQPTVIRMKNTLVKEGMVTKFTVIPNLRKMGYDVATFTSLKIKLGPEFDREKMRKKERNGL